MEQVISDYESEYEKNKVQTDAIGAKGFNL
jgi:hypothetical protein